MNTLKTIAIVSFILWSWGPADQLCAYSADQPYSSYWHPDELLGWSPASDRDAPYNRSSVPLADRFTDRDTQVNAHARPDEGLVVALSIMYPSTSNNPSQGSDQFDVYAFNYWQYVDLLVVWGGSAGEGLILSPSADVIDAAHRNGVPVYGTIFLPPVVYGGQLEWVWDLVQKEGETFPVADRLIEVAEHYGFDGWFINQETAGGNAALASQMRDFMKYIKETSEVRIMWYDAMTESGSIAWQNALTTSNDMFLEDNGRVSDEMFLNFWWSPYGLITSGILAGQLSRDRYDLYAGIDVQANGYNTYANWEAIFPEDTSHTVSLGFYCPNWCFSNSSGHEDFYERANRFWVGENGDPGNTATSACWKGVAHYVPAKSSINDIPFATSFNTGQGYLYAIDGQFSSIGTWNNRSLQSILPTWRWIAESNGVPLQPELDWSDAYHGGTCLKVHGDLSPGDPTHLKLFKTQLTLTGGEIFSIVYKTGPAGTPSNVKVGFAFQDDPGAFQFLDVGNTTTDGWNTKIFDLGVYSGKTVACISLKFESGSCRSDYTARIGQLALSNGAGQIPSPPTGAYLEHFDLIDAYRGTARLRWTHSPGPVYTYYVYRVNPDSSRTFLGGTPNNAYFVSRLDRVGQEELTGIEVQAVGPNFARSQVESTSVSWDETGAASEPTSARPGVFQLSQNYPNPFNADTEISYQIPEDGHVTLKIYAITGQEVRILADKNQRADWYTLSWDGRDDGGQEVSSGIYLCRLEAGDYKRTIKMVLVR